MSEARFERALSQRMYLLNATRVDLCSWKFVIEGSRGVPYTICMDHRRATCTCPDFLRRFDNCKHIMFISTRVMRMPNFSAIITPSMDSALETSLLTPHTDEKITEVLLEGIDNTSADKTPEGACPICFEDFEPFSSCEWCRVCKNPVHDSCIQRWTRQKQTCPLCRSHWAVAPPRSLLLPTGKTTDDDALYKFGGRSTVSSSSAAATAPAARVATGVSDPGMARINITAAKKQYRLKDADLAGVPCELQPNPINIYGNPMRLYLVRDLIAAAERCQQEKIRMQEKKQADKEDKRKKAQEVKETAREAKRLAKEAKRLAKEAKRAAAASTKKKRLKTSPDGAPDGEDDAV